MMTKANLRDKQIMFRMVAGAVYLGTVKHVETDGLWIDSPNLVGQIQEDQAWGPMIKKISKPLIFVPISALMFVIAAND